MHNGDALKAEQQQLSAGKEVQVRRRPRGTAAWCCCSLLLCRAALSSCPAAPDAAAAAVPAGLSSSSGAERHGACGHGGRAPLSSPPEHSPHVSDRPALPALCAGAPHSTRPACSSLHRAVCPVSSSPPLPPCSPHSSSSSSAGAQRDRAGGPHGAHRHRQRQWPQASGRRLRPLKRLSSSRGPLKLCPSDET